MAKIKKIYKKINRTQKELVYPATITQAIKDGVTGETLPDILNHLKDWGIAVADPVTLAPGATPTVTNEGDDYYVNLRFGLPAAPKVNVGSVSKVTYNQSPRVYNSGTEYDVVLNFDLQQGVPGAKGDKGDGWTLTGFAASQSELPSVGTKGDFYLVGTASPYEAYVHDGTAFRLIGSALEIKAGVFDGGRADSLYGGARTIDCGRADL